jgi:uncharacterized protein (TIGR02118 family)
MSSNNKVTANRRRTLIGLTGLAASASALKMAWGADAGQFVIKRASLLQRKPGMSHEEFVKHWTEIHAPMARACPGIGRYALTIIKSTSTRKDVAAYDIQVDGIAEMWFKSQADFDAYSTSPATKRLRDDGATFIGREIDFVTEEKVIIS